MVKAVPRFELEGLKGSSRNENKEKKRNKNKKERKEIESGRLKVQVLRDGNCNEIEAVKTTKKKGKERERNRKDGTSESECV